VAEKTFISKEAVIVKLLRQRKLLFPNIRIFREDVLLRAELIGQRLRDPLFFADVTSYLILMSAFYKVLGALA